MIYMDHNATTSLHPDVLKAMLPFLEDLYGNASSIHTPGTLARDAVEKARESVAALIGASADEIIFTSGGTESVNLAIKGAALACEEKRYQVITSEIEHHAVLNACRFHAPKRFRLDLLPCDSGGVVIWQNFRLVQTPDLILVSIMQANNETGVIQPIREIADLAHEAGAVMHTDAVQSLGKIPVHVDDLGVDLLSMSAHKIYGPKGVGALYVREGTKIVAQIHGGHQERGLRAGTENVAGIVGFGKAAEIAAAEMEEESKRVMWLRDVLSFGLGGIENSSTNGRNWAKGLDENLLPNTINVWFDGVDSEALVLMLDEAGIAVSNGAACESNSLDPSHVLRAMGLRLEAARSSIRFSLGRSNTQKEVEYVIKETTKGVEALRSTK